MKIRKLGSAIAICVCACAGTVHAAELLTQSALERLGAQRFWELNLPMDAGEVVARTVLLDDNLYVFTNYNRVHAIHALTGIVRWSRVLADPDRAIRGPSHAEDHVFFTTGGSVVVLNRRTGDYAGNPRSLRGVVIEVEFEKATISIGTDHGVNVGDVLQVFRQTEGGDDAGAPIATLKIDSVRPRTSKGPLQRLESSRLAKSGDRVSADVVLPLEQVKLPFAASCAAVADTKRIYVGASNERFYSLDIVGGFQHWQLMTPKTVTATPVLFRGDLFLGGQDGVVTSCTKDEKAKKWTFETEGPIFADLLVLPDQVFVASSDRSLYCLDRRNGKRLWRQRFDSPLTVAPKVAEGRVYQEIEEEGLIVLDAATGEMIWQRSEGGQFLVQFQDDAYLLTRDGSPQILRVEAKSGRIKEAVDAGLAGFAAASAAEQFIVLTSSAGGMTCIRSKLAPRLSPELVADVLRNDEKARIAIAVEAGRRKPEPPPFVEQKPSGPTLMDLLFEEDWLTSGSTAKPAGGRGLVDMGEPEPKATKPAAKKPAAKEEEDAEAGEDESAEGDEGEAADEESAESGDESEEEASEEEEATSEPADSEEGGEEAGEDESGGESEEEAGGDEEAEEEPAEDGEESEEEPTEEEPSDDE